MATETKIYTKKGDDGSTSLLGGPRVNKNHDRLETYGTLDELNGVLGVAVTLLPAELTELRADLVQIQNILFNIGSELAATDETWKAKMPHVPHRAVDFLEQRIDQWTQSLPPLRNFILPGGHPLASQLHVARAVARRAERLAVALHEKHSVDPLILAYLNRLSDFLFVASRFVNFRYGIADTEWNKNP